MDLPQPPPDQELKNIIDKLAQFVARNGLEFEQMTKTKQKGNPKFSFLFGGEYFNYYQYKVTTEQAILKHRQGRGDQGPQSHSPHILQPPPPQSQMQPFSGPPNGGYSGNYPYPYPPSSGFGGGEPNQFPPGVVVSGFQQPQYPLHPIPGGDPAMPMNSGPSTPINSGASYGHPQMPPNSTYPPGEPSFSSSYTAPTSTSEAPFPGPPQHGIFTPQTSIGEPTFTNQQQPLLAPSEHVNSAATNGYQAPPPPPPPSTPGPLPGTVPINGPGPGPSPVPGPSAVVGSSSAVVPPQGVQATLESIAQEEQQLQEQITQSEQNLTAQQQVLDQQRELQVREGVYVARSELLKKEATDLSLIIQEFDDVLMPIMESCTKDSISNGKHWIFTHAISPHINSWISSYLLYKATCVSGPFTHKLHIIYLMNDVLHHCLRKNAENLKENLEKVLSPMYCHAVSCATDDQRTKLDKLLSLWESKMHLDDELLTELRSPIETWSSFEKELLEEFPQVVATVTQHLNSTFEGYQQQHNAFVQHATNQIQQLEQQTSQMEQQQQQQQQPQSQQPQQLPPQQPPAAPGAGGPGFVQLPSHQQAPFGPQGGGAPQPLGQSLEFNQPPPGFTGGSIPGNQMPVVDFSKPPPGFMEDHKENLIPTVPYFELPAGLMAPLIKLDSNRYLALDPSFLRLPLPTPPSERLLRAVENFYQPPCHDRPRNCDGWEQLALYDYYKAKSIAVKDKERLILEEYRERSRSPSPVVIELLPPEEDNLPLGPIRRYRSVSPEPFEEPPKDVRSSRQHSPDAKKVPIQPRTASPLIQRSPPQNSRSPPPTPRPHSRSKSRSRSPSKSPSRTRSRSRSRSRSYSKSKSRSRSPPASRIPFSKPRSRSITPPSFGAAQYTSGDMLDESNKGHQMLRSMGWSGTGLGAKEQGISVPIPAAEVRETQQEKFRGLGTPSAQSDPYEAFRKNKGQAFINRMKARAEERS